MSHTAHYWPSFNPVMFLHSNVKYGRTPPLRMSGRLASAAALADLERGRHTITDTAVTYCCCRVLEAASGCNLVGFFRTPHERRVL